MKRVLLLLLFGCSCVIVSSQVTKTPVTKDIKLTRILKPIVPVKDSILNGIQQIVNTSRGISSDSRTWDSLRQKIDVFLFVYWRRGY